MNAEKTPAPETVPQFFWDMMDEAGMQVIAENVVVVYEQGQGGDIVTEIGTLVKPNETQEAMTPGMLWLMPKDKQTDEMVRMIQINRRFLIEIGSAYANEDSE
ncbi:hypothetical protein [Nocardia phage NC1]|nr:hypothetical protein [Nocardia phage NC1]QSL67709.1 hypothetical protein [Nocardia phage P69]